MPIGVFHLSTANLPVFLVTMEKTNRSSFVLQETQTDLEISSTDS